MTRRITTPILAAAVAMLVTPSIFAQADTGSADFTEFVALGDSLVAGEVSNTLVETSARHDDANAAQLPQSDIGQEQSDAIDRSDRKAVETIRNRDEKIGRNDPCPCGSGKKYKSCCLRKRV